MTLLQEMLLELLQHETLQVSFPALEHNLSSLLHDRCYQTLEMIQAILRDDSLSDPECFQKIEAIVQALEKVGGGGGERHDFG